ncbi:MAG: hypothetical protein U1C73_01705, partial [Dietzia sp.]|nr:hypothetical protein [Dietzia sp.]
MTQLPELSHLADGLTDRFAGPRRRRRARGTAPGGCSLATRDGVGGRANRLGATLVAAFVGQGGLVQELRDLRAT